MSPVDGHRRGRAEEFFPNFHLDVAGGGFWTREIWPIALDHSRYEMRFFVSKPETVREAFHQEHYIARLADVVLEDLANVERTHRRASRISSPSQRAVARNRDTDRHDGSCQLGKEGASDRCGSAAKQPRMIDDAGRRGLLRAAENRPKRYVVRPNKKRIWRGRLVMRSSIKRYESLCTIRERTSPSAAMIKPQDAEFHHKPDSHWQWAETIALPFHVPDANLNGIIYVLARPMLGVCMCDVSLHDRLTDLWEEQLYIDNQQHLPCPGSLLDFALPNGLRLKAVDPVRRYHAVYEGIDDTRFDLTFTALHEPYDINDPDMDPTAAKRNGPAWDASWSGHFEVTYRITGDLVVRGKRYRIDCVDTGDRSWGPRPERDNSSVIWWHASFGEDLTVHLFTGHDIAKRRDMAPHVSGYVLEEGQIYGLVDSKGVQEYRRSVLVGGELTVTDVRGKTFHLTYSALNSNYWAPYPSNTYLQTYMRVNCQGRIGYGVQQMGLSRAYLTRHRDALRTRY